MELSTLLEKRVSIVAVLGMSAFLALTWTVGDGVVQYASNYKRDGSQVLGEKSENQTQNQCLNTDVFQSFLTETKKTISLYAPDREVTFSLEPLKGCFVAKGCDTANFACSEGKVSLVESCVNEYFAKYPLQVEQTKIVSGSGAVAQVQVQDWSVNYANVTEQLIKAVSDEITYCQVEGKAEQSRQNIGSIQLVVSDEMPSMKAGTFTNRFIELDASKEKVYFWNDGVYQTLSLMHGARLPKEGVYKHSDIGFAKIMNSTEALYLGRNSQKTDYVVVHQ